MEQIVDLLAGESAFKKPSLQRKIKQAILCIEYAYNLSPRLFSSYSAGKDSAVQNHLIALVNQTMEARILTDWSSRLMYPEIDSIIQWWRVQFPHMTMIDINISPLPQQTYRQYEKYREKQTREMFFRNTDGNFVGLRSEESAYRQGALKARLKNCPYPIYQYAETRNDYKSGLYRICPLQHWSTADIAAYIQKYQIPVLSDYYEDDKFEARTKTHLSEMNWVLSRQLPELRRRHPENYNVLIGRFPDLAQWG